MKKSTSIGRLIAPVFNRLPYAGWIADHIRSVGPGPLNRWQEGFVRWNAQRLGITPEESLQRYRRSLHAFRNGHGGLAFSQYTKTLYDTFGVFCDWNEREAYEAYRFYAHAHLLRMLSYPETIWPEQHVLVEELLKKDSVSIGDFGCGLAHHSIALAQLLQSKGKAVTLHLADIPTVRKDFLLWFCKDLNIEVTFQDTTQKDPFAHFVPLTVCIATKAFEHPADPIPYFEDIDASLQPGGLLYTQIKDHGPDPSHFSMNLHTLRERIAQANYQELNEYEIFQKPIL